MFRRTAEVVWMYMVKTKDESKRERETECVLMVSVAGCQM